MKCHPNYTPEDWEEYRKEALSLWHDYYLMVAIRKAYARGDKDMVFRIVGALFDVDLLDPDNLDGPGLYLHYLEWSRTPEVDDAVRKLVES